LPEDWGHADGTMPAGWTYIVPERELTPRGRLPIRRDIMEPSSHPQLKELAFLSGGGELGALMRAFDWSGTSIGPAENWPQSLRTAVGILLRSPIPIVLLWGEDGVMIYNDAYSVFAGGRHPELLGSNVREGWPEVADFNDNVMKVGLAGGTLSYTDQELTLYRTGRPEQVWMNLDYSPVLDDSGQPAGVIAIVVETTQRVLAERRIREDRERLRQLFEQAPGFIAMLRGPDHVFELTNPAYMQHIGQRDILGKPMREALPEISGQGYLELLDQVYQTGEAFEGSRMKVKLQRTSDGPIEERYVDFVYQPVTDSTGAVTGVFAEGHDVTERVRGEAHQRLLINELNHRMKNTFATMQAIVMQTLKGPISLDDAREALSARILALSRAQDVLTRENWDGADLVKMVEAAIAPFENDEASRFTIEGPPVRLGTRAALALSLSLHELATNAAKYGSLSTSGGRVGIEWSVEESGPDLVFLWKEIGGPPVAAPSRKGFGSHLIERGLARELDAEVNIDYARHGVVFTFKAAMSSIEDRVDRDGPE
jgi:PAS domain S-box-containing protein